MWVCGRKFEDEVLQRIRMLVSEQKITRAELSRRVAAWLDWKDCHGRPKAMNCRVALLKLERRGVIQLPARRTEIKRRAAAPPPAPRPTSPVKGSLAELGALTVELVEGRSAAAQRWKALIATHHPLGYQPLCGRQRRYLVHR